MKKNNLFILLILIISSLPLFAVEDTPEIEFNSPHASMRTHLSFLQEDNYKPSVAAMAFNVTNPKSQQAQDIAEKLLKIYDGRLLLVQMNKIPEDPNYIDSVSGLHRFFPFPQDLPNVYLEKNGDKWLYSKETVEVIPDLFNETYPFDLSQINEYFPSWMNKKVFGLQIWQIVGLFIYIILSILLYLVFSWIFGYFVVRIYRKFARKDIFSKYVRPVAKPASILLVVTIFKAFVPILNLPIGYADFLSKVILVLQPLMFAAIAYQLTELLSDIFEKIALKTKSTVDDHLVPLVRKTMKIIVVILGGMYIINNLGYNITPLLAGASIGGLALALAAKDALSNLFGSVTIFADQPFEVGDWIKFNGMEGTVEEVGVRSTRIRTFYNSQISVPNGKLTNSEIDNMGRRKFRRYSTQLSITYDTPPDLIDAFVQGLRDIVSEHPNTRKDYFQIHLNDFASSSINVLFYIFFDVPDWAMELKARGEIISKIIHLAEKLGVRFAFPTQTVHVENFPEKKSLTPIYKETREEFMQKLNEFKENKKN